MIRHQPKPRGWCFMPGKSVVRGFDTSQLYREDALERIRHLQAEVKADLQALSRMKKEHAATRNGLRG